MTPVFDVLDKLSVELPDAALPGPLLLLPPIVPIWLPVVPWLSALDVFGPGDPGALLNVLLSVEPSRVPAIGVDVVDDDPADGLPADELPADDPDDVPPLAAAPDDPPPEPPPPLWAQANVADNASERPTAMLAIFMVRLPMLFERSNADASLCSEAGG